MRVVTRHGGAHVHSCEEAGLPFDQEPGGGFLRGCDVFISVSSCYLLIGFLFVGSINPLLCMPLMGSPGAWESQPVGLGNPSPDLKQTGLR